MESQFKYIPMYLEAKTRKELIKKMIEQNLADSYSYRYFDIQYDIVEKLWIAWFYPESDKVHKIGQKVNQTGKVGDI